MNPPRAYVSRIATISAAGLGLDELRKTLLTTPEHRLPTTTALSADPLAWGLVDEALLPEPDATRTERLVLACLGPRRTQPVSKCNSPVNPGCSILRGQSTLAHSPPSPSQFFTPIANVGANSFKQRSTERARFRFFDACSCS